MTKFFKQAKLAGAVAAALTAAMIAPSASAVNISNNGLGEVAISPFYTVRNGFDTYLSIVNTSLTHVIAVKLRFRESANSRDARDFVIFLSPNDVWTAVVTMNDAGIPVVQTSDNSCTAPALKAEDATAEGMRGIPFTTTDYDGTGITPRDGGSTGIDRTYSGHFEVIEMGAARPGMFPNGTPIPSATPSLAANAVHVAGAQPGQGVPKNCNALVNEFLANDTANYSIQFGEPLNVMKVSAYLLNQRRGVEASLPVEHLSNFSNNTAAVNPLMQQPALSDPNLDSGSTIAVQILDQDGVSGGAGNPVVTAFARSVDAVSSLFMATHVINEYAIGGAANALNDWVVTFPTKNFYVDNAIAPAAPIAPFKSVFQAAGMSCEDVQTGVTDREEFGILDASPLGIAKICNETNVLAFDTPGNAAGADEPARSVLTGVNNGSAPTDFSMSQLLADNGYTSGVAEIGFTRISSPIPMTLIGADVTTGAARTFAGLPVTGFSIRMLTNGTAGAFQLDHGIVQPHSYIRNITP